MVSKFSSGHGNNSSNILLSCWTHALYYTYFLLSPSLMVKKISSTLNILSTFTIQLSKTISLSNKYCTTGEMSAIVSNKWQLSVSQHFLSWFWSRVHRNKNFHDFRHNFHKRKATKNYFSYRKTIKDSWVDQLICKQLSTWPALYIFDNYLLWFMTKIFRCPYH